MPPVASAALPVDSSSPSTQAVPPPGDSQAVVPANAGLKFADFARSLFLPLSVTDFADAVFGRSILVVPGAKGRFSEILPNEELLGEAAGELRLGDGPDIRRPSYVRASYRTPAGAVREIVGVPSGIVRSLLDAGMTLTFGGLEVSGRNLKAFTAAMVDVLGLARKLHAECVTTIKGDESGWRYEAAHTWHFQMSGSQRVRVGEPAAISWPPFALEGERVDAPLGRTLKGLGLTLPDPPAGECLEHHLNDGDLLYLPPGTWYQREAGGHSCHLTLAAKTMCFARLVRIVLTLAAHRLPAWRRDLQRLQRYQRDSSTMPAELEALLTEGLADLRGLIDQISPQSLTETVDVLMKMPASHAVIQQGPLQEIL